VTGVCRNLVRPTYLLLGLTNNESYTNGWWVEAVVIRSLKQLLEMESQNMKRQRWSRRVMKIGAV